MADAPSPGVPWGEFAKAAPDIADAGVELLFHPGFGFGYLATVRRDGFPRISPVDPLIRDGRLLVFVTPSPKLRDMRARPRIALHSSQTETVDDEFLLTGHVRFDLPTGLRARALEGNPLTVGDDHELVELTVRRAIWVHYESPGVPTVRRWAGGEAQDGM